MKKHLATALTIYLTFFNVFDAIAKKQDALTDNVQTINNNIQIQVYAFKKKKHYTAVEIGFANLSDMYAEFTPKEIYLDDEVKYSQALLSMDQIHEIERQKPSASVFPAILGVGLGIAALATARSNSGVAYGLFTAAAGVGGAALLTKAFEDRAKQNKFIAFENNTLNSIKKLPPGMTLGGVLYFPPTKKPKSITIVARSSNGGFEKKTFLLMKK